MGSTPAPCVCPPGKQGPPGAKVSKHLFFGLLFCLFMLHGYYVKVPITLGSVLLSLELVGADKQIRQSGYDRLPAAGKITF